MPEVRQAYLVVVRPLFAKFISRREMLESSEQIFGAVPWPIRVVVPRAP